MASKLGVYNSALIELGQRTLSSLTENTESRRVLDDLYDDVVADCLAGGQWNFAIRTVKSASDTGITTNFGYNNVFAKPTDLIRLCGISSDEYNSVPLVDSQYKIENDVYYTDQTPIYLRYVSNGTSYGLDLDKWTQKFTRYVVLELAFRSCVRLTQSDTLHRDIFELSRRAKRDALNKDALEEGTRFPLTGRLVNSRLNYGPYGSRRDRGNRGSFTG